MQRIILGGNELGDFPEGQEGGYIKLILPEAHELDLNPIELIERLAQKRVRVRSYTVRTFNKEQKQLTLDMVCHGDNGPASAWANQCAVGDIITINGPGPVKLVDNTADWFFIAGDMTALPAISVNLEQLPANAKGYAVIEVISQEDKLAINAPKGIEVQWVINPHPDQTNTLLADKVKNLCWLDGKASVWFASEFETMRNLRHYFRKERMVARENIYISSYWKMGDTDEGNKLAKKRDLEAGI